MNTLMGSNYKSSQNLENFSKTNVDRNSNSLTSSTLPKRKIIGGKNIEVDQPIGVEEQYIQDLQKQIYILELEMKLMKDREIDTKNKVGGYGIHYFN